MKKGSIHNLFHMIIKKFSRNHFTVDIMVKVVLIQENQLGKMIRDEVVLILYSDLLTFTIESRMLIHIQVKQLRIIIPTMHNTRTYSRLTHTGEGT